MKKNKLILATKILAIVIVCLIAFVGIYVQKLNSMQNVVKDFTYGKDLKGYRQITLVVCEDEGENSEENLTIENYEKSKDIIIKRIKELGVEDYNISLDKNTGMIYLQIPENDETDRVVSNIAQSGAVEITDSEDEDNILISSSELKKARVLYTTTNSGTVVILQLQLNKEGTEKLKNLSENEYKTISEDETESDAENTDNGTEAEEEDAETSDENEEEEKSNEEEEANNDEKETDDEAEEEETAQKKIALYISGNQVTTTSFDEPIEDGKIDLSMSYASTDTAEITETAKSGNIIATIINNGPLPVEYDVEMNQYVSTDISNEFLRNAIIVGCVIVVIALVYMIIKNKANGILGAISYIGFIAIYMLVLRYFNVVITLESIVGIAIVAIINYIINIKLLEYKEENKNQYNKKYLQILLDILPAYAISIILCFTKTIILSSFGMTMFWGISLIALYNILVTKYIVE